MLSTSRLKHIYAQEQKNRKYICVMNDLVKTRQDVLEGLINKAKAAAAQRNEKSIVYTRRNIVRQRVLKQCMSSTRAEVGKTEKSDMFGSYHGVPVEQIASGIDTYLEQNHPRIRRRQKINEQIQEGYARGTILDNATVLSKVNSYFARPLVNVHRINAENIGAEKKPGYIPSISAEFYTGHLQKSPGKPVGRPPLSRKELSKIKEEEVEETQLFIQRKVTKFLVEDVPDDVAIHSARQEAPPRRNESPDRRPMTLPPTNFGADRRGRTKPGDTIAELVAKVKEHKQMLDRKRQIRASRERPRDLDAPSTQRRHSDTQVVSLNVGNRTEMSTGTTQMTPKKKSWKTDKDMDLDGKIIYPTPKHADKNARVLPPVNVKHSAPSGLQTR